MHARVKCYTKQVRIYEYPQRITQMDYNTLPVGLGLAFATNRAAMDRFVDMTDDEKKEFVERSPTYL